MSTLPAALVVEPNTSLQKPYSFIDQKLNLTRVTSVKQALQALNKQSFSLFLISASYSPDQTLTLLDAFKNNFQQQVIPLIIVIDLKQPLSTVPGTQWGGRLAILSSVSSQELTLLTVDSLMSA